jgi:hypothetical protein
MITPSIFGVWELSCKPHFSHLWDLIDSCSFAMLTGKPPFQSATADEIYRRARQREYDWPTLNTSENFISQETKDLVSELLQPPEKRPDPDTIVQHPFFTCGWLPQSEEMTPELRERQPNYDQFLSVGVRAGKANLYVRNLKKLCIKCEVGPWNSSPKEHESTYREVAAEEKAGLTPAVPLPEGIVYRPYDEVKQEVAKRKIAQGEEPHPASDGLMKILEPISASKANEPLPSRPATQSFAAQQRARPQPSAAGASSRQERARQTVQEASSRPTATTAIRNARSNSKRVESKVFEAPAYVEDRLAADLAIQLNKAEVERKSLEAEAFTLSLEKPVSLFHPRERLELIPHTKPDLILESLRRLQTELERALNSRSIALETKAPQPNPTIVVKWVDYTNKFGLGYILSNGSVGCIFKATTASPTESSKSFIPPSCVVVRDAERHLQNRGNEGYADRHQLVPISGPSIEFFENRGENGISRGKVNPQNYKVSVGRNGEAGKLSRGQDEWDDRKREKIVLWKKFGNYMTAFGRDQDYPIDEALGRTSHERLTDTVAGGNVVTFYQRFGDVGCWAFCDGHFQVNSRE